MAEKQDGQSRGAIDKVSRDNILRLHENQKELSRRITEQDEIITRLQSTIVSLQGDIQNTKQLVAFLQGRGIGSTESRH